MSIFFTILFSFFKETISLALFIPRLASIFSSISCFKLKGIWTFYVIKVVIILLRLNVFIICFAPSSPSRFSEISKNTSLSLLFRHSNIFMKSSVFKPQNLILNYANTLLSFRSSQIYFTPYSKLLWEMFNFFKYRLW